MDSETSFENHNLALISSWNEFQSRMTFIVKQRKGENFKAVSQDSINELRRIMTVLNEGINNGVTICDNVIAELPPIISWIPDEHEGMQMSWETGITPGAVWLKYLNRTAEIDNLIQYIRKKWLNNELEREHYPEVGKYCIVCTNKRVYRGLIISLDTKLQILNVDDGKEREEDPKSCYKIVNDFCKLHANVIQCAIGKENVENLWNMKFFEKFVSLLQYSRLTVSVIEKIEGVPPIFKIDLVAFNEDSESEVNVVDWVHERCHGGRLSEAMSRTSINISTLDLNSSVATTERIQESMRSSQVNLNHNEEIRARQEPISRQSLKSSQSQVSLVNGSVNNESRGENRLLKVTQSLNLYQPKEQPKKKSSFKFEEVVDVPEFLPVQNGNHNLVYSKSSQWESMNCSFSNSSFQCKANFCTGSTFRAMNGVHENSVIPGNYIPQDDDRICAFFKQYNYCWKVGCKKEHVKTSQTKWTEDKQDIFNKPLNELSLPQIGSKITVLVTYVMSPTTFFVRLPDSFSEIKDGESIEHLVASLNHPNVHKELKILSTPPCFSESLIAFCETTKQWGRANVTNVCDDDLVEVFFVDTGITEVVSISKCRETLPQFNHLPFQAVYSKLSGIFMQDESNEGTKFLTSQILDKTIEVKVTDTNEQDLSIEVEAFCNDVNINELMVQKGFCSKLHHH